MCSSTSNIILGESRNKEGVAIVLFNRCGVSSESVKKIIISAILNICYMFFLDLMEQVTNHLQSWPHTNPHESRKFTKNR
jgi:hypothetical protein